MKRLTLLILTCLTLTLTQAQNYCSSTAFGYGASASGGGSATPTLVSSFSELKSAIASKAKNKVVIITKNITFTSMLNMQDAQNVTLMALPGVKLISTQQNATSSGILFVKRSSNIIIRNITFEGPGAYDCDGNDNLCFEKVTNAWVDHCDFQDGCDGNFDNKSTTDNVTVSWCRFRYLKEPKAGGSGGADDHRFTNLLGSSSSDQPSDGTYNFTWAYCWWDEGCKERMIRCRNAELHFLNCYWNSSVANYYVGPENANAYFEGCSFAGKANTTKLIFKSYGGTNACKFVNCSGKLPSNSGTVNAPTYTYDKLSADNAKTMVTNTSCGAGATLIVTTSGQVSSSCDGGSTPATYYTVTWNANGGSASVSTNQVQAGDAIGTLPSATREGYTFNGWFTAATGGTQVTASTKVNSNITYYAQYTEDQGGGGDTPTPTADLTWNFSTSEFNALGELTSSTTVNSLTISATTEKKVTIAALSAAQTIAGATFTHVLKLGGTGSATARNLSFPITGDCTIEVYLVSANKASIRTLNIYKGSYATGSILTTMQADSVVAAKQTYNYTGGATTIYLGSASSGINLYAINLIYDGSVTPPEPEPNFVLSYDENGGTGVMDNQEQTASSVTVATCTFTPPVGYTFLQWNTNYKGSGTTYTAGESVTLTADLTLYAVWQPNTYTVTLDPAGGTGGTTSVTATFDAEMPNISIPSREGYTFLGYIDVTGTQYYDANGTGTNNWIRPSNATLTALWEENSSSEPATEGDLHFWFFNAADAAANGVTNDATMFSNMVAAGSQMAGTITIDGNSYSVTKRTGDAAAFGSFTIPADHSAVFYGLAVSSGGSSRQINLVCGTNKIELEVPGGSSVYQRLESDILPAGTYSIEREGSSNVRMGIVVIKLLSDTASGGEEPEEPTYYTVTWDANGGTCAKDTSLIPENTAVGSLPEAAREGYTFDGWFTGAVDGEQISATTLITADITFYAHYTEIIVPPTPQPADEPDVVETSMWWNMSDDDFKALGTLTADTAIRQLHITARPKAAVTVDGNNKTIDGISFTHRLKYGGSGSDSARVVWFDVKGACTIDLYLMSSSSGNTRTLNIASDSLRHIITTMPAATTIGKQSYSYTGEQTRLYLYPDNGGINVYGIRLTYPADPPTDLETITNNQSPITNKLLLDGHLLIHHDDHYYNAQGQLLK